MWNGYGERTPPLFRILVAELTATYPHFHSFSWVYKMVVIFSYCFFDGLVVWTVLFWQHLQPWTLIMIDSLLCSVHQQLNIFCKRSGGWWHYRKEKKAEIKTKCKDTIIFLWSWNMSCWCYIVLWKECVYHAHQGPLQFKCNQQFFLFFV